MRTTLIALSLCLWTLPAFAKPAAEKSRTFGGIEAKKFYAAFKDYREVKAKSLRANAEIFKKITVNKDWSGDRILFRDPNVTAFLDISDPEHPYYTAEAEHYDELASIPEGQRAHVLVVPNVPREHIAKKVNGRITTEDLAASLTVMKSAEAVARRLGIDKPLIFVNPSDSLSVGYLHVHIIGTRQSPYPTAPTILTTELASEK